MIQRLKQLQENWSGAGNVNLRCTEIQVLTESRVGLGTLGRPPARLSAHAPASLAGALGVSVAWCDGQKPVFGSSNPGRMISQLLILFLLFHTEWEC